MCQQLFFDYDCGHIVYGRKQRCKEAHVPTKYRLHCKAKGSPIPLLRSRILPEWMEKKAGICFDCAQGLLRDLDKFLDAKRAKELEDRLDEHQGQQEATPSAKTEQVKGAERSGAQIFGSQPARGKRESVYAKSTFHFTLRNLK
ncbi:hypothetical protein N7462_009739 [Penicillium macrosclerotiorum]|uniref:uncharacterized protein n=1 Tax=Penicillium macrosclerotiorum TaxID=303699 RepID=UPI002548023A|nr:uncharacterized protein N7462_009739 [Penicillium macrosclerotiorum]KAJ5668669.1 hypothetical protein N7462_009739 [Penicillium macrosclerotiorum]